RPRQHCHDRDLHPCPRRAAARTGARKAPARQSPAAERGRGAAPQPSHDESLRKPMEAASEASSLVDPVIWGITAAIVVLLVLSAIFSGSETALTTASRGKLHGLAERGDKRAQRALAVTEDKEQLIGAILLGNNLVNILAASLATMLFTRLFGESGVAI